MDKKIIQTIKIAAESVKDLELNRRVLYLAKFIEAYKRLYPYIKKMPSNMQFEAVRETTHLMSDYVSHCFDVFNNKIGVDEDNAAIIATYRDVVENIELTYTQKKLTAEFLQLTTKQ